MVNKNRAFSFVRFWVKTNPDRTVHTLNTNESVSGSSNVTIIDPHGPQGLEDTQGSPGSQGPQGLEDTQGSPGSQGPQGSEDTKGSPGPQGPQESKGTQGMPGPQGPQGSEDTQGPGDTQGPPGPQGPQGSEDIQGLLGPQGPHESKDTEGPPGPQGPQGSEDTKGSPGPQGPQESEDIQGLLGPQGPQGSEDTEGPPGPQGPQGSKDTQGSPGPQGPQESEDPQGPPRPQGPQGPQGSQSPQGSQCPQDPREPEGPPTIVGGDTRAFMGYHAKEIVFNARDLTIENSDNADLWSWYWYANESTQYWEVAPYSKHATEVIYMWQMDSFEITRKYNMKDLTPNKKYEVVFIVIFPYSKDGWESPVTLSIDLPDGSFITRNVKFNPRHDFIWETLKVGEFIATGVGEINISMLDVRSKRIRKGLYVRNLIIRQVA